MFPQITLHPLRNARLQDLSKLHHRQLRSLSTPPHHSRRLAHLSRTLPQADDVAIRGREAICQREVLTPMVGRPVGTAIRRAASAFRAGHHHHKVRLMSNQDQQQQSRDDDPGVRIPYRRWLSKASPRRRPSLSKHIKILNIRRDRR